MVPDHLPTRQDTVLAPADAPARSVFVPASGIPLAEAADRLVAKWQADWEHDAPAALVLVGEREHAALLEHLLGRLERLGSAPGESSALSDAVRAVLDGGATLVAGGRPEASAGWEPTVFVNLSAGSRLFGAPVVRGPVLGVVRVTDAAHRTELLRAIEGPFVEHALARPSAA